ncbi:MAG TPA: sigma factor-like helix-turn-helix DNA-binding protein [Thermoleophilaceae bacterium]
MKTKWSADWDERVARRRWEQSSDPYLNDRQDDRVPYRTPAFEPHDAATKVLIREYTDMARLPYGELIVELLDEWRWLDAMAPPEQKQRFLEPLIAAIRKDPHSHTAKLVFLLIVCEPVRRSVSRAFVNARGSLDRPPAPAATWHRRSEARMLREIEQQALFDVTRAATLEALYRYPVPAPRAFFPWLREAIAHRTLNHLHGELPEIETTAGTAAEAVALQNYLAGFENAAAPAMREEGGFKAWRARVGLRSVFEISDSYYENSMIRTICQDAIGRLPRRQREFVESYFYAELPVEQIAAQRGVSTSTIYNTKTQAQDNLREDDYFFFALHNLGLVRDRARAAEIERRYPDGRLLDGRRIVAISDAA